MITVGIIKASQAYFPLGAWGASSGSKRLRYIVGDHPTWHRIKPIYLREEKKKDE